MTKPGNKHRFSASIHEFFLDEELLLFSDRNYNLYRLNTSAAFIWCHQLEGFSIRETTHALAAVFAISNEKARHDVLASLAKWRQLGLLATGGTSRNPPPQLENERGETAAVTGYQARESSTAHGQGRHYYLAGLYFRIRFAAPEIERAAHPLFAHLAANPKIPIGTDFEITQDSEGYLLLRNAVPLACCTTLQEIGPIVHGEVLMTTCKSADCLAVIHAAAISDGKHTLLFPGDSGSGKSILTAALITAGYAYLSDEIALLGHRPYHVLPVPLSIGLKEGAWSVLSPLHPGIKKLPVYHRQDGKKVRYLPPPPAPNQTAADYPVTQIIFPHYIAETAPQVRTISRAEALCRITEGGYSVNGPLSAAIISELVHWISGVKCYEMRYSSLSQALNQTQELIKPE